MSDISFCTVQTVYVSLENTPHNLKWWQKVIIKLSSQSYTSVQKNGKFRQVQQSFLHIYNLKHLKEIHRLAQVFIKLHCFSFKTCICPVLDPVCYTYTSNTTTNEEHTDENSHKMRFLFKHLIFVLVKTDQERIEHTNKELWLVEYENNIWSLSDLLLDAKGNLNFASPYLQNKKGEEEENQIQLLVGTSLSTRAVQSYGECLKRHL